MISSSRNNAVGALPIATTLPGRNGFKVRPVPPNASCPLFRHLRNVKPDHAENLVVGRQTSGDDAVGHHLCIADNRRAGCQRIPRRRGTVGPAQIGDDVRHAAGVDQPDRDVLHVLGNGEQISFLGHDREGPAVDFIGILCLMTSAGFFIVFGPTR